MRAAQGECPVCHDQMCGQKEPLLLPCSHHVCSMCWPACSDNVLYAQFLENKCPVCQHPVRNTLGQQLPVDEQLMKAIHRTGRKLSSIPITDLLTSTCEEPPLTCFILSELAPLVIEMLDVFSRCTTACTARALWLGVETTRSLNHCVSRWTLRLDSIALSPQSLHRALVVSVLDSMDGKWRRASSLLPGERKRCGLASLNGKLYVSGGLFWGGMMVTTDATAAVYDVWTRSWSAAAPMPSARSEHLCTALGGKLYVLAGRGPDGDTLTTVDVYDPSIDAWTSVSPMLSARYGHTCTALNGKLYVVGGIHQFNDDFLDDDTLDTVDVYDPNTDASTSVARMLTARCDHACTALDGKLYVVGGMHAFGIVDVYDPNTDAWVRMADAVGEGMDVVSGHTESCSQAYNPFSEELKLMHWTQVEAAPVEAQADVVVEQVEQTSRLWSQSRSEEP